MRLLRESGLNPYRSAPSKGSSTEVLLRGGLGNQLFGFAAGFDLAKTRGTDLHLVTRLLEEPTGTKREFELGDLVRDGITYGPESTSWKLYLEKGFSHAALQEKVKPNTLLDGYFQSSTYFTRTAQELKSLISQSHLFSQGRDSVLGKKFIALQVRRGDYLLKQNRAIHGLVPDEYFARGLRNLRNELGNLDAIVFSDSPEVAIAISEKLDGCLPYREPVDVRALTVLGAMSAASGLCISNSTFGWWGAYLSAPGGSVIAPSPWFRDSAIDFEDIYEPHWKLSTWRTGSVETSP